MSRVAFLSMGLLLAALAAAPVSMTLAPVRRRADIRLRSLTAAEFNEGPELPLKGSPDIRDLAANRLIFPQREVHLWVQFDPPGMPGSSFVIDGLLFPEIELHAGTRLEVVFLNLNPSTDVSASFAITSHPPPFATQPVFPDPYIYSFRQFLPGYARPLRAPPPRGRASGYTVYGAKLSYDVLSAGEAWYVDNFIGAANTGEYGRIVVVP